MNGVSVHTRTMLARLFVSLPSVLLALSSVFAAPADDAKSILATTEIHGGIIVQLGEWALTDDGAAVEAAKLTAGRAALVRQIDADTDAYRVVNADADFLSGLIVDRLGDVLSIEVSSIGVMRRLPRWIPILHDAVGTKREIYDQIRQLADQGTTVLMVEQNVKSALKYSDDAIALESGRLVLHQSAAEILADPEMDRLFLGGAVKV